MTEHPRHVTFESGAVVVDAAAVAAALGLTAQALQQLIRSGQLATVCETGIEADAGTWRLTFRLADRRLRLVVDSGGRILKRSIINFGNLGAPRTQR